MLTAGLEAMKLFKSCKRRSRQGFEIDRTVYNHVGLRIGPLNMPMKDWVHQWPSYTNSSYKDQPLVDPTHLNWIKN
jgi:hypothetical protein